MLRASDYLLYVARYVISLSKQTTRTYDYLRQGGYVFTCVYLFVC